MKTKPQIRNIWNDIRGRCNNPNHRAYKSYGAKGVTVSEEWDKFDNFYDWYVDNYYEIGDEIMCVDKDILNKHSMEYSPENCCIVPIRINNAFVGSKLNANGIPSGIRKMGNRYEVYINEVEKENERGGRNRYVGSWTNLEDAIEGRNAYKTKIIRGLAERYKPYIPTNVYEALLKYEV